MKITITGKNIKTTEGINNYIKKKLHKIITRIDDADVSFSLQVDKNRHIAEVTVKQNGFIFHINDETKNLYTTLDNVIDKTKKHLINHKNKNKVLIFKKNVEVKNKLENSYHLNQ
jgi:putative sigma-54 modulation protein